MTRISQRAYHNRNMTFWYMECDTCNTTRSSPEWSHKDLPLERFTAEGWRCRLEHPMDTCPACLAKEATQ